MTLNSFCFVASWRQHTAYRRPTSWFDSDERRRGLDILEQPSAIFDGEAGLSVGFIRPIRTSKWVEVPQARK